MILHSCVTYNMGTALEYICTCKSTCLIVLYSHMCCLASKNTSDLWLAYWVSQPNDRNASSPNSTLNMWLYSFESEKSLLSGSMSNYVQDQQSVSNELQFYLGIYGALAFANSVRFMKCLQACTFITNCPICRFSPSFGHLCLHMVAFMQQWSFTEDCCPAY